MKKVLIALVVLGMVFCLTANSYAQHDSIKKLVRGITNGLTGWVELPKNIYQTSVDENMLNGFTIGLGKGLGWTVMRTAAGIYEIGTFPFPLSNEYASVIDPEFVWGEKEEGAPQK